MTHLTISLHINNDHYLKHSPTNINDIFLSYVHNDSIMIVTNDIWNILHFLFIIIGFESDLMHTMKNTSSEFQLSAAKASKITRYGKMDIIFEFSGIKLPNPQLESLSFPQTKVLDSKTWGCDALKERKDGK